MDKTVRAVAKAASAALTVGLVVKIAAICCSVGAVTEQEAAAIEGIGKAKVLAELKPKSAAMDRCFLLGIGVAFLNNLLRKYWPKGVHHLPFNK